MSSVETPRAGTETPPEDARGSRRELSVVVRALQRPEAASVVGALAAWALFAFLARGSGFLSIAGAANYLVVSAQLGLVAVPVSLLMIAGEFDLSVGSMSAASGMVVALLVAVYEVPLWLALIATVLFAVGVGWVNGAVTRRTGLPSFIVTLAGLFVLRGATLGVTRLITNRTLIGGVGAAAGDSWLYPLFAARVGAFPVSILWWLAITAAATVVLVRTPFGNWIYGAGGDPEAARNSGVPIHRVKSALFIVTALSAALLGVIVTLTTGSADVLRGELLEFEAIIAAVVGGTLLTGGYGSPIGAFFGALTFGVVSQGIFFAGFNSDWFLVFLGAILLLAVLANNYIRETALAAR